MSPRFSFVRALASNRHKSDDAAEVFERGETLILVLADRSGRYARWGGGEWRLGRRVRAAVADPVFAVEDVQYWVDLFSGRRRSLRQEHSRRNHRSRRCPGRSRQTPWQP
jgi:hypothetical protein